MAERLNYGVGSIPFKYLGILVKANPKKQATWQPVIECITRRLSNWKSGLLSFGGCIILLNSVLSSIPVYFFSIYRAPKKVIQTLTSIQRKFLWGGTEERDKIAWFSWDRICRGKLEGGLGVKNLEHFNLALLGKWRWRFLIKKEALWVKVIRERYGTSRKEGWWKKLCELDEEKTRFKGWLKEGIVKVVGEGNETYFWEDRWVGERPLKEKYERLYRIAVKQEVLVSRMGKWDEGE
ncbi:hypothetical protein SLA2020_491960 [Shorea laevis]